jgi:hypothetical protein
MINLKIYRLYAHRWIYFQYGHFVLGFYLRKLYQDFHFLNPFLISLEDLKIYKTGDIVVKNMKAYIMYNESSTSGNYDAPPNKSYYIPLDYQNKSIYIVGDIVNGSDGLIYVLINNIGKAGDSYAPPSNNWQVLG